MPHPTLRRRLPLLAGAVSLCLMAACSEREAAKAPAASRATPPIATTPRPMLEDVLETTGTHIIGISYPKELARYPGLASEARRYAENARQQVVEAAGERSKAAGDGPYELSLEFKIKHESPSMVVLAVDGSSYTGGAHGAPMIQRWVWLPDRGRRLTVGELFPDPASWKAISDEVRTQLQAELAQRLDADGVTGGERSQLIRTANAMIDGGTEPGPGDFAVFEPVLGATGRITALRFVFPPYQIGSYSEGMRTVELPSTRLVQHVAPAYRAMFEVTS
ncbi:DUF3298 and DUF4163 domain-containing protein [Lysobacter humi (ex Lee et al. 2017)]